MDKKVKTIKTFVMKKVVLLSVMVFFISVFSYGQSVPVGENCIYCGVNELGETSSAIGEKNENSGEFSLTVGRGNKIGLKTEVITLMGENNLATVKLKGSYSIGMGTGNSIKTDYSYILGKENIVEGKYGVAIGLGNNVSGIASVALGSWCKTYKTYGIAVGMGCEADSNSTAIGFHSLSLETKSFSFGSYVKSTGNSSMSIGAGMNSSYLENDIDKSLMIGFYSDKPTLFVGPSSGVGTTGSIGIGNVTNPQAKLHIKGDTGENTDILLEAGSGYGIVYFGDTEHSIKGKPGYDMIFHSQTGHNFAFENGNIMQTANKYISTSQI